MAAIDIIVRARQLREDLIEVVEAINRELFPIVKRLHEESNRAGGDVVTVTADYSVALKDGTVICDSASAIAAELPDPSAAVDKRITVVRAGAGAVTVTDSAGGTISGVTSWSPSSQWNGYEFLSDGSAWYVVGAF